jgi:hypothetical protein
LTDPISQKNPSQKRAGKVAQGVDPEFQPQYHRKKGRKEGRKEGRREGEREGGREGERKEGRKEGNHAGKQRSNLFFHILCLRVSASSFGTLLHRLLSLSGGRDSLCSTESLGAEVSSFL